jgi:phosphate transport system protein
MFYSIREMTSHLEESLERDIDFLCLKLSASANMVERGLRDSLQALLERNRQLAFLVILRDQRIDEAEKEIDRLCLEFLVRQQPVAQHLRLGYVSIKINTEIERIGDYAESIARQAIKLSDLNPLPCAEQIRQIANLAIPMFHNAVQAFIQQDSELARKTMQMDEEVNTVRNWILNELLAQSKNGQIPMEFLNPLLTVARRFERAADQAKNMCEEVLYLCTGEYSKHKGTEALRVLFVDEHNGCLTQMAEAIGNTLQLPRLMFASAGIDPKPIDSTTSNFLFSKRLGIERLHPKSIAQIPNLERYQVIVAFCKQARKAFTTRPGKAVMLDWSINDPSASTGSSEHVQSAYSETFRTLQGHVKDLAEAMLGETGKPILDSTPQPVVYGANVYS